MDDLNVDARETQNTRVILAYQRELSGLAKDLYAELKDVRKTVSDLIPALAQRIAVLESAREYGKSDCSKCATSMATRLQILEARTGDLGIQLTKMGTETLNEHHRMQDGGKELINTLEARLGARIKVIEDKQAESQGKREVILPAAMVAFGFLVQWILSKALAWIAAQP